MCGVNVIKYLGFKGVNVMSIHCIYGSFHVSLNSVVALFLYSISVFLFVFVNECHIIGKAFHQTKCAALKKNMNFRLKPPCI